MVVYCARQPVSQISNQNLRGSYRINLATFTVSGLTSLDKTPHFTTHPDLKMGGEAYTQTFESENPDCWQVKLIRLAKDKLETYP